MTIFPPGFRGVQDMFHYLLLNCPVSVHRLVTKSELLEAPKKEMLIDPFELVSTIFVVARIVLLLRGAKPNRSSSKANRSSVVLMVGWSTFTTIAIVRGSIWVCDVPRSLYVTGCGHGGVVKTSDRGWSGAVTTDRTNFEGNVAWNGPQHHAIVTDSNQSRLTDSCW